MSFDDSVSASDAEILALGGGREFIDLFSTDWLLQRITEVADTRAEVVVVEGLFLFQCALVRSFDLRIRLEITDDEILRRAIQRDTPRFGAESVVIDHYSRHCIPAQHIYRRLCGPSQVADLNIDAEQWQ